MRGEEFSGPPRLEGEECEKGGEVTCDSNPDRNNKLPLDSEVNDPVALPLLLLVDSSDCGNGGESDGVGDDEPEGR